MLQLGTFIFTAPPVTADCSLHRNKCNLSLQGLCMYTHVIVGALFVTASASHSSLDQTQVREGWSWHSMAPFVCATLHMCYVGFHPTAQLESAQGLERCSK